MAGLEEPIRKGLHFLELFVMPDGSSPASLSWRGTNFLMPFAIERWSPDSASARRLAPRVRQAIASGLLPTPSTVDDRYAAHFFLPSFIDAHFGMSSSPSPRGIEETRIEPDPSKCGGLYVAEGEEFRTCVQARKGGVAVHANGLRKVIWDAPTYCLRSRGKLFMPASSEAYRLLPHSEYSWESTFRRVREEDAAVKVGAGLLPFSHLVGGRRLPWLSGKIEARVKRAAFEPGEKAPVRIRRHIRFSPDEVSIRDLVEASGPYPSRLVSCHWTAPTNSPSSLFFSAAEQGPACALEEKTRAAVAGEWESQGRVESEIVITKSGHGTTVRSTVNGRDLYEEEVGARLFY
ncbi:MAG: hypothetical protein HZA60_05105 [Deltaproteobacteria bacterium]|nr:hypothetical protein [Deltaproteobacteria bacterium]